MTQRGITSCILGCLVVFGLCGEATANHMTGRYTMISQDARTASMAGSVLQLQQSGRNLMGQIAGSNFQAQLQGETDGGNNARGFMTVQSGQRHYFEAVWDQSGMRIALVTLDNQGRPDYNAAIILQFAREGGGGPSVPGQPGIGPPPGGQPGFDPQPGFRPPPGGQPGFDPQPGFRPQPGFGGPPGSGGQPGFPPQGQPGGGFPPSQQGSPGANPPQPGPPPGQWPPQR